MPAITLGHNEAHELLTARLYYQPTGEGEEAQIRQRLEAWAKLRAAREQSA